MGVFYQANKLLQRDDYTYVGDDRNEDLGNLTIDFTSFPVSPYVGLIFGNYKSGRRCTVAFELGTLFHGKPRVNWVGEGIIAPTAEQDEIVAGNVSNYNWWPYANFQINYKLNKTINEQ